MTSWAKNSRHFNVEYVATGNKRKIMTADVGRKITNMNGNIIGYIAQNDISYMSPFRGVGSRIKPIFLKPENEGLV